MVSCFLQTFSSLSFISLNIASMLVLYSLNTNPLFEAFVDLFLLSVFLLGTNFLGCLVIFLQWAAHFSWKLICGTSLWPIMKKFSSRENFLLLLPSCLRPLPFPDHFNLNLGLKFFNYPNDMKFVLKKCTRADFCGLRCVPSDTGSAQDQSHFSYSPLEVGVGRIHSFLIDPSPEDVALWGPSFMSRVSH